RCVSTVGLVPLYGCCDSQKLLALFAPADPFTPAALFLLGQWWSMRDILRTDDSSRDGLRQVETLGERIVLYVLNRIVYRVQERNSDEPPFLCHGAKDFAKILWQNGEAVGFYSVKPTGSSCSSFSSRTYPLPVMDSIFVRKCHRGNGLGLHMLEDYVDNFKDDCLGLKYPLTTAMYKVCQSYLCSYPGDAELLWEVDSCRINQRTSIASRIQSLSLRGMERRALELDKQLFMLDISGYLSFSDPAVCGLQLPHDPATDKWKKMDGWMNCFFRSGSSKIGFAFVGVFKTLTYSDQSAVTVNRTEETMVGLFPNPRILCFFNDHFNPDHTLYFVGNGVKVHEKPGHGRRTLNSCSDIKEKRLFKQTQMSHNTTSAVFCRGNIITLE
uniref:Family with sequence similarity 169 member Aa n=1 Tax=Neogobius melanostomus TaxID=47308 RepID=A0A8C6WP05_9GOBI